METASMLPEPAVLSAAPEWSAAALTSNALMHRTSSALRRKTRPRSPQGLTDSPDLSRQASQSDQSRTDGMQSPFKDARITRQGEKGIDGDAEPASSTAPHVSDLDLGTDVTSDDDYSATNGVVKQNPNGNASPNDRQPSDATFGGRPIWEFDSEASSDEEEDAREDYRRLLRKRTSADRERAESAMAEMRRKRKKGLKESQNQKQGVTLVAFTSVDAGRAVPVLVEAEELEDDLAQLFGEVKGEDKDKMVTRKTVVGSHSAKHVKKKPVVTGVACCSKDFVKHSERKGWVVCVYCDTEVWPPNINKHKAACKARSA